MNAILLRRAPSGIDMEVVTDPSDPEAALMAKFLYELIRKLEEVYPEPEATA